jgi:hypothetical protein
MEHTLPDAWQSYLAPVEEALRLLRASPVTTQYPVHEDYRGLPYVTINGEEVSCWSTGRIN